MTICSSQVKTAVSVRQNWVQVFVVHMITFVTLNQLLNLIELQFLHPSTGDIDWSYLTGLNVRNK